MAQNQLGTSLMNQSSLDDSDEQFAELLAAPDAAFGVAINADGWKVQLLVKLTD